MDLKKAKQAIRFMDSVKPGHLMLISKKIHTGDKGQESNVSTQCQSGMSAWTEPIDLGRLTFENG